VWPLKKSPTAQERDEEARVAWRREGGGLAPELFGLVDECGTHTSMTRLHARAPKGKRTSMVGFRATRA